MPAIPRPFIAAGVAVVGTSAIAMSPVTVAPPVLRAAPAVHLTATTDWVDVFTRAGESASALFNSWLAAPAPVLQQILANQQAYLGQLPDVAGIAAQVQANIAAALAAPLAADLSTLDTTHRTFYQLLPAIEALPGIPDLLQISISPTGKQLLALSTTALSGVLLGMAGPVLGPLIVLAASLESVRGDLSAATPDLAGAMSTLADIPAAMTDAFLNGGQHVDLTALMKVVGPAIGVSFPNGVQVGVALGGLLSPGGSAFNALDFAYDNNLLDVLHIHVPLATGTPVGPIGSMMELARTIAKAIGWQGAPSVAAAAAPAGQTPVAQKSAPQSLVAANEVPRSVSDPDTATLSRPVTANAARTRAPLPAKRSGAAAQSKAADAGAKSPSAPTGSGKASSARTKSPAKAAAAG
ncbi:outer membrane porin GjpA [Mycobacterium sp. shizuoka-1]|uniref:outer membrane porin GjpA n=1 Tax=Mycobacterium sp. shizuoka-1 TaxID=2039281 RepID=UPI000C06279A|nr:outer membrane porin GjpA [Mycobacterium sp. shizuoka-1]GAY13621.1 hypothetical protein MSZK_03470 [Mycobacterium sp. shizuoka-1]